VSRLSREPLPHLPDSRPVESIPSSCKLLFGHPRRFDHGIVCDDNELAFRIGAFSQRDTGMHGRAPCHRRLIGIGGGLTTSPLPPHRTYGSRLRRYGRGSQRAGRTLTGASSPGVPAARSSQMPGLTQALAGCHLTTSPPVTTSLPLLRPSARCHAPPMLSADCCRAVREDGAALSPLPGTPRRSPVVSWHPCYA
jgi:hypothetical protein